MSNQNRFLLPHTSANTTSNTQLASKNNNNQDNLSSTSQDPFSSIDDNQLSVDTDFDSYWEEEARNPHRNRIRIGRQYQASVPALLKQGEKDRRKLEDLETLSFCPKKSAKVSDSELDHYFTVAKSLNLFASLVETRSLLGRDVTIADLNRIRHKEGLSLASVIQPARQNVTSNTNVYPPTQQSSVPAPSSSSCSSSPPTNCDSTKLQQTLQPTATSSSSTATSPKDQQQANAENYAFKQPLMKALSHFINLHHPCHHDSDCKKLLKDIPLEDDSGPVVSITAGNLRQGTSSTIGQTSGLKSENKPGRSRSSLKQAKLSAKEEVEKEQQDDHQMGDSAQSPTFEEWTREEVELFSKAIEVCGKNFSSIKKDFLPSKSVKSIVEYYYIGSRDVSDSKKKSNQAVETSDSCSSPEKPLANNNGQSGGGSSSSGGGNPSSGSKSGTTATGSSSSSSSSSRTNTCNNGTNKTINDTSEESVRQTTSTKESTTPSKSVSSLKQSKQIDRLSNGAETKSKNLDPRMSVYNFDEELKDESPMRFECPKPGAEVKPLKAKPIMPNAAIDGDGANSNVGSLKFFMDGQLVLKLNACQEQQEGIEKCHWVQSGEKVLLAGKQKRYSKRSNDKSDSYPNGSQSDSVVSSYQDDDSKNEDLTNDEDSKESANSFTNLPTQQQKNQQHASPNQKRQKVKTESYNNSNQQLQQQQHLSSPINYNRIAVNNRMKERNDTNLNTPSPVMNQAMPWLQANSFAMAAALLSGLPFPPQTGNIMDNPAPQINLNNTVGLSSKPMDLSLEHSPKSLQKTSSRSSRGEAKKS